MTLGRNRFAKGTGAGTGHPQSEAQQAASKHNFALMLLLGMKGNLHHLQGHIRSGEHLKLEQAIEAALRDYYLHKQPPAEKEQKDGTA